MGEPQGEFLKILDEWVDALSKPTGKGGGYSCNVPAYFKVSSEDISTWLFFWKRGDFFVSLAQSARMSYVL